MNITFEPNGSILVSGELDLFEKGDARKTELKGDINSGEISGIWGTGDLIKIKIESKKELDEKKRVEDEKKKHLLVKIPPTLENILLGGSLQVQRMM